MTYKTYKTYRQSMAVGFFEGSMASEMSNKEHLKSSEICQKSPLKMKNAHMIQRTVHLECMYSNE